jgi:hypothetical protein
MKTYKVLVSDSGDKFWYFNGILHREDGPAVEYANGYKAWYLNNKCHRKDGPAIEFANGDKSWYLNGFLHREDGPAIEYANGYKAWWFDGKRVTEEEVMKSHETIEIEGKKYTLKEIKLALDKK